MKVCYFGTYEENYPRNSVLIKGLEKQNIPALICHKSLKRAHAYAHNKVRSPVYLFGFFLKTVLAYIYLIVKFIKIGGYKADFVVVGYPGYSDILVAFLITRITSQKLIYNPMISIYDALIVDRNLFKEKSFAARILFRYESFSMRLANHLILDTSAHIEYIKNLYSLPNSINTYVLPLGALSTKIKYNPPDNSFKVIFWGTFSSIHNIPIILESAKNLKEYQDIQFLFVGAGAEYSKAVETARELDLANCIFMPFTPHPKLFELISSCNISLGQFGTSKKAMNVIPIKLFESLALQVPVITEESPATSEFFENKVNIVLCAPNNADDLADKILFLRNNRDICLKISDEAYTLYKSKFNEDSIGKDFVSIINNIGGRDRT